MRIGIFGGTFNPLHTGHLLVLEYVQDQLQFERVLLIPSANPPHKNDPAILPPKVRLEMISLAVKDDPIYRASDLEMRRPGSSYTVDTLRTVRELHPSAQLSLIIGVDNFLEFDTWKSPDEILDYASLIVMNRPGFSQSDVRHRFARDAQFVNVPLIAISGTEIRMRVKMGKSIRYFVPPAVESYIVERHLYR